VGAAALKLRCAGEPGVRGLVGMESFTEEGLKGEPRRTNDNGEEVKAGRVGGAEDRGNGAGINRGGEEATPLVGILGEDIGNRGEEEEEYVGRKAEAKQ